MKKLGFFFLGFITCTVILLGTAFFFLKNRMSISSGTSSTVTTIDTNSQKSIRIVDISGSEFLKLKDTFSRTTIVNFWASWCIPCKAEIPLLINYAKAKGYNLVFVTADKGSAQQKKLMTSQMSSLGISQSYIMPEHSAIDVMNKDAMTDFAKNINLKKYPGGIPYIAVYKAGGVLSNEFVGFSATEAFESYFNANIL